MPLRIECRRPRYPNFDFTVWVLGRGVGAGQNFGAPVGFQALELVQTGVIERMQTLGITDSGRYNQELSTHDIHLLVLGEQITGMPAFAS